MSRSVRMDYEAIRERQARAQESLIAPETKGDYILWPPRPPIFPQEFGPAPTDHQPHGHSARY